ncbi:ROK family protein, partial [Patescibacteria group bacterium]|nr:ROK family protein [Patescibacteria group bacterium]
IYRGATGSAGEFGHTNAGLQSELESMSSGKGISKIYKHLTGKEQNSFEIVKLTRQNDALALKTLEISAKNFGIGIANIIELLNPDVIVLGGGLSEVDLIIDKAKEYAKKKVFLPSLAKTPIAVSKLGQNAIALGAAWMARDIKNVK